MKFRTRGWGQFAKSDLLIGLCVTLLSLSFFFVVAPAAIELPRGISHFALSPLFLPQVLAAVAAALGLAVALRGRGRQTGDGGSSEVAGAASRQSSLRRISRPATALALLTMTVVTSPWAGMTLASAVAVGGLLLLGGERRIWIYALLGGAVPYITTFLFQAVLNVPIPGGLLFD